MRSRAFLYGQLKILDTELNSIYNSLRVQKTLVNLMSQKERKTMANYNASGLVTLAKLAEEAKAKKAEEEKEVCENTEQPKECVKRMIEAFSDCD